MEYMYNYSLVQRLILLLNVHIATRIVPNAAILY